MSYKIKRISRPKSASIMGGRLNIHPLDILPHLPGEDCFFDCRHWVYDTTDGILPFAVTTRIAANCQQWLIQYE